MTINTVIPEFQMQVANIHMYDQNFYRGGGGGDDDDTLCMSSPAL